MPRELGRLQQLIRRGLEATAPLWGEIEMAYGWVHAAAHVLGNAEEGSRAEVRSRYAAVLRTIRRHRSADDLLGRAARQFLKVTKSYAPGLFCCYAVEGLPRTNNDLEHVFGSARYHERRASGRKVASPALVLRGSVRITAALATRLHPFTPEELRLTDRARWQALRAELERREEARRAGLRFRRNPRAYLGRLEEELLKQGVPP